jgi:hypothetical protein
MVDLKSWTTQFCSTMLRDLHSPHLLKDWPSSVTSLLLLSKVVLISLKLWQEIYTASLSSLQLLVFWLRNHQQNQFHLQPFGVQTTLSLHGSLQIMEVRLLQVTLWQSDKLMAQHSHLISLIAICQLQQQRHAASQCLLYVLPHTAYSGAIVFTQKS